MRHMNVVPQPYLLLKLILLSWIFQKTGAIVASKQDFYVGIVRPAGWNPLELTAAFEPTFKSYLDAQVGSVYTPPLSFHVKEYNTSSIFYAVQNRKIDFVFSSPFTFACLESEFELSAGSTLRRKKIGRDLSDIAGVIVARENQSDIQSLEDIRGKIVAVESLHSFTAGQSQWHEMLTNQIDFLSAPAQIRIVDNESIIIDEVTQGTSDIGFLRSETFQRLLDVQSSINNTQSLQIIHNLTGEDGYGYPFPRSTDIFPEWVFGIKSHVDYAVSKRVDIALMQISNTSIEAIMGNYSTWEIPHSYIHVRDVAEEIHWMERDPVTDHFKCVRAKTYYEEIVCPTGYIRKSYAEVMSSCSELEANSSRYTCPSQYHCICNPCRKSDIQQVSFRGTDCERMKRCVTVEQLELIQLNIKDHQDTGGNISYIYHSPDSVLDISKHGFATKYGSEYDISFTSGIKGVHMFEVFLDGMQIESSPTLIQIQERTCDIGMRADEEGHCYNIQDEESDSEMFFLYGLLGLIFPIAGGFYCFIKKKGKEFSSMISGLMTESLCYTAKILLHIIDFVSDTLAFNVALADPKLNAYVLPLSVFMVLGGIFSFTEITLNVQGLRAILCMDDSRKYKSRANILVNSSGKMRTLVLETGKLMKLKHQRQIELLLKKVEFGLTTSLVSLGVCLFEDIPFVVMDTMIVLKEGHHMGYFLLTSLVVNCISIGACVGTIMSLKENLEMQDKLKKEVVDQTSRRQSQVSHSENMKMDQKSPQEFMVSMRNPNRSPSLYEINSPKQSPAGKYLRRRPSSFATWSKNSCSPKNIEEATDPRSILTQQQLPVIKNETIAEGKNNIIVQRNEDQGRRGRGKNMQSTYSGSSILSSGVFRMKTPAIEESGIEEDESNDDVMDQNGPTKQLPNKGKGLPHSLSLLNDSNSRPLSLKKCASKMTFPSGKSESLIPSPLGRASTPTRPTNI